MGLLQLTLLLDNAVLIVFAVLLELGDLLFDLSDVGLKAGLLEGLGLLVVVDFLFGNEVVERFPRVLRNDGINLCSGILREAASNS